MCISHLKMLYSSNLSKYVFKKLHTVQCLFYVSQISIGFTIYSDLKSS